jgi:voltage-gated potassium channel
MNPGIKIISRASDENVEKKLIRAGANHVVMPDALGGYHMAHIVTKPFIFEFVELLSGFTESDYMLEEVSYDEFKAEYQDVPLADLEIRRQTGATVLGFKNREKGFVFNPGPHTMLSDNNVMIILGRESSVRDFKRIYTRSAKTLQE